MARFKAAWSNHFKKDKDIMALGYKTGGRKKGTPNKKNPLKGYLRTHSLEYFEHGDGEESAFERDLRELSPAERVQAELRLMKYHTPEMQAVRMDASVEVAKTIEDKLLELSDER